LTFPGNRNYRNRSNSGQSQLHDKQL